jgi:hypothetical protein
VALAHLETKKKTSPLNVKCKNFKATHCRPVNDAPDNTTRPAIATTTARTCSPNTPLTSSRKNSQEPEAKHGQSACYHTVSRYHHMRIRRKLVARRSHCVLFPNFALERSTPAKTCLVTSGDAVQ